jgi:ankyrin repeat protein
LEASISCPFLLNACHCCALLGSTPVLYAFVGSGSTAVLRYLLHHGAYPNKAYTKGFTALHYAAMTGSLFGPYCVCFSFYYL